MKNNIINMLRKIGKANKFKRDFRLFKKLESSTEKRFDLTWEDRFVCLDDATANTGFDRHYVYHPAWAAKVLASIKPNCHTDIGSDLKFVTQLSAFVPVDYYDYRPADVYLENFRSKQADLCDLHAFKDESIKSLSCMHVIEHIGLGRYGDSIDYDGDKKAAEELKRVLAFGGDLLIVLPVGVPKIQYNAHRIYSYEAVEELFTSLKINQFMLVPDKGEPINNASSDEVKKQKFGCGCFWFKKV